MPVVVNVVVFGLVLAWLARRARGGGTLSRAVLLGVALGVACGALLQAVYGLDSPTVLPLAATGMHAVHAVVDRSDVVELLGPLREAGARSLLVLPIENLIP